MKIVLSCKEAARIVSEGLDTKLTLSKKLSLRLHLVMCKGCTLYQKQITALKSLFHDYNNKVEQEDLFSNSPLLSQDGQSRLKSAIKKASS